MILLKWFLQHLSFAATGMPLWSVLWLLAHHRHMSVGKHSSVGIVTTKHPHVEAPFLPRQKRDTYFIELVSVGVCHLQGTNGRTPVTWIRIHTKHIRTSESFERCDRHSYRQYSDIRAYNHGMNPAKLSVLLIDASLQRIWKRNWPKRRIYPKGDLT